MIVIFLSVDGFFRVFEVVLFGQFVVRIFVLDLDDGDFVYVNVFLEGGEGYFVLSIQDSVIYLVCVVRRLDREERDVYNLRVIVIDLGLFLLRVEVIFVLYVIDVNDNVFVFDRQFYRFEFLFEVVLFGSFVVRVMVQDFDQGINGQVIYSLVFGVYNRWFFIDFILGIIITVVLLDYELEFQLQLIVVVIDGGLFFFVFFVIVSVVL